MSQRFRLIIDKFAGDQSIRRACQLIYETEDDKLMASMGSTPYEIGRSFSKEQKDELKEQFLDLDLDYRFINEQTGEVESNRAPSITKETEQTAPPESPFKLTKQGIIVSLGLFSLFAALFIGFQFILKPDLKKDSVADQKKAVVEKSPSPQSNGPRLEPPPAQPIDIEYFEAKIQDLENKVEIRRKNQIEWEPAQVGMLLKEGDRIRTFHRSFCSFQYREGSRVQVSEDSLVVVGTSLDQPDLISREIALENGSLRTQLISGSKTQEVGVDTKQGFVQLRQPKDAVKSSQFETLFRNNRLNVRVARGNASFKQSKEAAETIPVDSNQQIIVTENSVSEPVGYRPPLRLFSPQDGTKITYSGQKVQFNWENLNYAVYEFILAGDVQMENVLFSQELLENNIELNYLDSGFLFWQVKAVSDGIEYLSPIYRLHVE